MVKQPPGSKLDFPALFTDNQGDPCLCSEKAAEVPEKRGRETSQRWTCGPFLVPWHHTWLPGEASSRDREPILFESGAATYKVWWSLPAPSALEREDCVQVSSAQEQSHFGSRHEVLQGSWGH